MDFGEWGEFLTPQGIRDGFLGILVVVAIMRGWLVPKITAEAERANHAAQIKLMQHLLDSKSTETDQWRQAYMTSETGRSIAAQQADQLLDGLQTVEAVLRALPRYTGGDPGGTSRQEDG